MHALLTNDDGIHAVGIRAVFKAMKSAGFAVSCVAPSREMSAVSHAITMKVPLQIKSINTNEFTGWAVTGTPADCVKLAVRQLLYEKPDFLISGINAGPNAGVDIRYSGTVAAAFEGALLGIPAIAVSYDHFSPQDLSGQAMWLGDFVKQKPWEKFSEPVVLNINFPAVPIDKVSGFKICEPSLTTYSDRYEERHDPRGRPYYWLTGDFPHEQLVRGTDRDLLNQNFITLSPLPLKLCCKNLVESSLLFQKTN